MGTNLIISS